MYKELKVSSDAKIGDVVEVHPIQDKKPTRVGEVVKILKQGEPISPDDAKVWFANNLLQPNLNMSIQVDRLIIKRPDSFMVCPVSPRIKVYIVNQETNRV